MILVSKAIAANSDLASAQSFLFQSAGHNFALIISGEGDDVFLRIKAAVIEAESIILNEQEVAPAKLTAIHQSLAEKLAGVSGLQVMIVAWSEDILYIQSRGHHYCVLFRNGSLINLITPSQDDQLISGHITPGDKVLFGTQSLIRLLGEITNTNDELQFLLKHPPQDFQDEIDLLAANKTALDPIAAILLEVEQQKEEQIKPIAVLDNQTAPPPPRRRPRLPSIKLPSFGIRRLLRRIPFLGNYKIYAGIAAVLVAVVIGFGIFKYIQGRTSSAQVGPILTQAQTKFNTAESLKGLNPEEAKLNLNEAIKLTDEALKLNPNNPQAKELKAKIDQQKGVILREIGITDWPVFLSLDLIKEGFKATKMTAYGDYLLLLDDTSKTLVLLDKEQRSNQILGGSRQLGNANYASINSNLAFSFSEDKGVVRVDTQNQESTEIIKPDPEWGSIKDITGFASNVYLLDSIKNQIWKYVPAANGYSAKNPYFQDSPNLQNASRMRIDSSVWVLKDNIIMKFTQGVEDFFDFSGLEEPIQAISTFYVSDETDNIYLIDPDTNRLLVFDKTGKYQAQYQGDKFKTATDLAVDEELRKIYILEGNKIYQLDLK